jgi:hypothetical protein
MWGALSDERTVLPLTIFCCLRNETTPNLEGPQEQGGTVIYTPLALGSLFVASYDSQGYGGGIRTRLHTQDPSQIHSSLRPG